MTETTTEPVAHPATTPPPPPPTTPPDQAQIASSERELAHTSGGIPVLPLALAGTNGAVGAVSTVALVGGGPIALAVAAGGAAVVGTTAAIRARRRTTTANGGRGSAGSDQRRNASRPSASRSGGGSGLFSGGRGRGRGSGGKSRTGSGTGGLGLRSGGRGGAGRHGGSGRPTSRPSASRSGASRSGAGGGSGRLGQVRALRNANRKQSPTRTAARQQTTAARRQVADARRNARATNRANKAASRGLLGRAGGWAAGKAAAGSRALVNKARAARDRATGAQVAAKRDQVRKAPARRKARWGLLKSASRFQGRRLLAALAGGAAGVLGCLTTPLGKKLGWRALIHPGRRLYARLVAAARAKRAARDEQIRATRAAEEAAADSNPQEIGDRVQRPASLIPTFLSAVQEAISVSGFKFEEAAAEMENAARTYDPDGNMEVLAMIDNLPTAMLSIANTFRILAERSDEEFAFEKDVAAGFDDIHRTLLNAVDSAETLVPLFRQAHEQDIARHEEPRNGTEAEKGWNV
ncbi:hypothetical protein [Streptomyces sp. SLBN-31]|uniref:hypothetical protein n=1 Tax=Streptomyces sp. SLBN-31 TaxID=2768444 RepID=UPI00115344A3|nr:hypothetical protein [Streptomyces sp. SLBN-31]TQJ89313.1 hypothetical protein FBY22_0072 [Streptomyces sp. SLBN-31]